MPRLSRVGVLALGLLAMWAVAALMFLGGSRQASTQDPGVAKFVLPSGAASPGSVNVIGGSNNHNNAVPQAQGDDAATIFVSMAAFREPRCLETLESLFLQARHPERLRIGLFQQVYRNSAYDAKQANPKIVFSRDPELSQGQPADAQRLELPPEDPDCLDFQQDCPGGHRLCRWLPQIRTKRVDFAAAMGPLWGRAGAQEMLRDEAFFLQIDTHSSFAPDWDVLVIQEWRKAENPRAILSTYPLASGHNYDAQVTGSPVICSTTYQKNTLSFMLRHTNRVNVRGATKPILTPFWAGGFSFGPAQALRDVPFDPLARYVFDGEEFSTGLRLFTHGYDIYAPSVNVIFHVYEPHGPAADKAKASADAKERPKPKFWEFEWAQRYPIQQRGIRRIWAALGINPTELGLPADFDRTQIRRYGIGNARTVRQYWDWVGLGPWATHEGSGDVCLKIQSPSGLSRVPLIPEAERVPDPYFGKYSLEQDEEAADGHINGGGLAA